MNIYDTVAGDLTSPDVRDRFRIAFWSAIDTFAVAAEQVTAHPGKVTWLTVTDAVQQDLIIVFHADGYRHELPVAWPIVLGEVTE